MLNIASPSEQVKNAGFAHTAATTAKTPIVIGTKVLIPINTAAANERNAFVYESEIDNAPAKTAEAWAANDPIYWDATAAHFTKTPTTAPVTTTLCGHALQPKDAAAAVSGLIAFDSYTAA